MHEKQKKKRVPPIEKAERGHREDRHAESDIDSGRCLFVWFNWQMLEIFREYASIPESYACAVIAATIGECGICGWIRTNKDRRREHQWEQEEKQAEKSAESKESEEMTDE